MDTVRREYVEPELIELGTLADLTEGGAAAVADIAMAGSQSV
jgi:hypothetical protein